MSGVLRDVDDAEADGVDGDDAMELLETILSTIQSLLFQKAWKFARTESQDWAPKTDQLFEKCQRTIVEVQPGG